MKGDYFIFGTVQNYRNIKFVILPLSEFLSTDPEVRVRFLRSSGSGRGPLSLVSTLEELLGRKNSCSGLEIREYGRRNPSR
jgi:hypothetical protein